MTEHEPGADPPPDEPVEVLADRAGDAAAGPPPGARRGLRGRFRGALGGAPAYPLVVLFGLNAVDELDRTAFGVLLPEIREEFGLSIQGVLTLIGVVSLGALALQVPIAALADRTKRVRLAWIGAAAWAGFSFMTGLAATIWLLAIARAGSSIGKATVDPTHNSLISDYYPPELRPRVFSIHRAANATGQIIGPASAGMLAASFGWRVPFFVFAVPTLVFVVLAWRLREPVRGAHERRLAGGSEEAIATEEASPSFAEGWRLVWRIPTLRRIWWSLPFLAASLIGFTALGSLLYEQVFGLDERARGFVSAAVEPSAFIGLIIGARVATRLLVKGPSHVLRFLSHAAFVVSAALVAFALAPNVWVAMAANAVITGTLAILAPGILASLSLAIPPRARSMGFSVSSLWVIPGLVVLPIVGGIGDRFGLRWGMLVMVPVFAVGGVVIASTRRTIDEDIAEVWRTAAARGEAAHRAAAGESPLLLVRGLEVGYDGVRVLHGIDLDVAEGEVLALLGTNGAGKSTLLRAIVGATEAERGAVILDGRDTTHAPPHEIAAMGVSLMPGGAGVFPSLTVEENLRLAVWMRRRDRAGAEAAVAGALSPFPALESRRDDPAANLSGGQQQQLALAMALLARPRLLLVDELSLGLAPVVVAQLLPLLGEARAAGTTVILVEQSVEIALAVADTAVFLEKGQVRFAGPAQDLRGRHDLLRAVFLPTGDGATPEPATETGEDLRQPTQVAELSQPATETGEDLPQPTQVAEVRGRDQVSALRARGLAVTFGGIRAVDRVDLDVASGEIVGLIGPNGAGKTTLFDVVSGFHPGAQGRLWLGDRDLTELGPDARARAGLGRSFQDARLFPALTVEEAIAVACERWVRSRDPLSAALRLPHAYDSEVRTTARVAELVELLGLGPHRSKAVRELSTGTRRIVDLACLLAHRPTVILLDEPSSGIAQREVEALAPLIGRIRDGTGASVLVVEHDIPLVRTVADRLIAMDQGRVIADGPPLDVLAHPAVITAYLGPDAVAVERSTVGVEPVP
jgi:ABC-type branched-subunit amino acid transport system ATPase component/predicted MFS family arabinose efflux permease